MKKAVVAALWLGLVWVAQMPALSTTTFCETTDGTLLVEVTDGTVIDVEEHVAACGELGAWTPNNRPDGRPAHSCEGYEPEECHTGVIGEIRTSSITSEQLVRPDLSSARWTVE